MHADITRTLTNLAVSVVLLNGIVLGETHTPHPLYTLGCSQRCHLVHKGKQNQLSAITFYDTATMKRG